MDSKLYLKENPTLKDFQQYVRELKIERGFSTENKPFECMLMAEEVGELFSAIRKNMKGGILMAKIYGYSLTVSTRGKCEERLEEQKKAIKEIYPDAEIIEEVMGLEKFNE